MAEDIPVAVWLQTCGQKFVKPYFEACEGIALVAEAEAAQVGLMLSTCDVYAQREGLAISEEEPVDRAHHAVECEERFIDTCRRNGLKPVILRVANCIGTGMTGWPRRLAADIYRGWFMHFPDNDARVSAIHATDVAAAGAGLCVYPWPDKETLVLNATDACDPGITDLANALAFRMNDKRISTLSTVGQRWIARVLYGTARMRRYTTTITYDSRKLWSIVRHRPTAVGEYLRNQDYSRD